MHVTNERRLFRRDVMADSAAALYIFGVLFCAPFWANEKMHGIPRGNYVFSRFALFYCNRKGFL